MVDRELPQGFACPTCGHRVTLETITIGEDNVCQTCHMSQRVTSAWLDALEEVYATKSGDAWRRANIQEDSDGDIVIEHESLAERIARENATGGIPDIAPDGPHRSATPWMPPKDSADGDGPVDGYRPLADIVREEGTRPNVASAPPPTPTVDTRLGIRRSPWADSTSGVPDEDVLEEIRSAEESGEIGVSTGVATAVRQARDFAAAQDAKSGTPQDGALVGEETGRTKALRIMGEWHDTRLVKLSHDVLGFGRRAGYLGVLLGVAALLLPDAVLSVRPQSASHSAQFHYEWFFHRLKNDPAGTYLPFMISMAVTLVIALGVTRWVRGVFRGALLISMGMVLMYLRLGSVKNEIFAFNRYPHNPDPLVLVDRIEEFYDPASARPDMFIYPVLIVLLAGIATLTLFRSAKIARVTTLVGALGALAVIGAFVSKWGGPVAVFNKSEGVGVALLLIVPGYALFAAIGSKESAVTGALWSGFGLLFGSLMIYMMLNTSEASTPMFFKYYCLQLGPMALAVGGFSDFLNNLFLRQSIQESHSKGSGMDWNSAELQILLLRYRLEHNEINKNQFEKLKAAAIAHEKRVFK